MLRTSHSLLTALVSVTVVVSTALVWAGWRLLDQQRVIDEQRGRDQLESVADAMAARIRGQLAETGERLAGWLSDPSTAIPVVKGAVVVVAWPHGIDVNPPGALPFIPIEIPSPPTATVFEGLEAIEFGGQRPERAVDGYRALAKHRDPQLRAGALLRLGRVLRKSHDLAGSLSAYQQLAALGGVRTDGLPAELAGLDGERSSYAAMADAEHSTAVGARLLDGLESGRWQLTRGTAEFYRDQFTTPRSESWRLAESLGETWNDAGGHLGPRGQRIFTADGGAGVLVMWRSNGTHTAAIVANVDRFLRASSVGAHAWQLVDPEGRRIAGDRAQPPRTIARIIGNAEYPWTLRLADPSASSSAGRNSRLMLPAMIGSMLFFVWSASYFMARAIRREAAAARLQSDFVAAVSHEFRSPLTTVRQMAEMLDADRVPSEARRHTYYRVLAAEAARLQRLVETLLNFGRMETGVERYRRVDLDAAALVRGVVDDIGPHAHDSGKVIEIEGPEAAIRILGDESALAVALRNLIDNAIKYSPDQPTVWVRCARENGRAAICVVDRGVGIPRSEQQAIFRKFVRGRAAIAANIKGTGVGLAMVAQIVTAHGGEIRVESEPGRGSAFTLLLPAVH